MVIMIIVRFALLSRVVVLVLTSQCQDISASHLGKNCQCLGLGRLSQSPPFTSPAQTNFRPKFAGHYYKELSCCKETVRLLPVVWVTFGQMSLGDDIIGLSSATVT